jgi:hypothetical protein
MDGHGTALNPSINIVLPRPFLLYFFFLAKGGKGRIGKNKPSTCFFFLLRPVSLCFLILSCTHTHTLKTKTNEEQST